MDLKLPKIKKLFIISLFVFTFLFITKSSFAVDTTPCPNNEIKTDLGCLPDSPIGFVTRFYAWGLGVIGLIGLLYLIIGGYNILMSRGNPEKLNNGKSYIIYAVIGILLAIFGFVFFEVIAKNILQLPGF